MQWWGRLYNNPKSTNNLQQNGTFHYLYYNWMKLALDIYILFMEDMRGHESKFYRKYEEVSVLL